MIMTGVEKYCLNYEDVVQKKHCNYFLLPQLHTFSLEIYLVLLVTDSLKSFDLFLNPKFETGYKF